MPVPRLTVVTLCCVAMIVASIQFASRAHDDHAPPPSDGFDPWAPRVVSAETARMIGLRVEAVDFGTISRIERFVGVVDVAPDGIAVVAARAAGVVVAVTVQPGDRVQAGEVIAEIEVPELARLAVERTLLDAEAIALQAALADATARVEHATSMLELDRQRVALAEQELARVADGGQVVAASLLAQRRSTLLEARTMVASTLRDIDLATLDARAIAATLESLTLRRAANEQLVEAIAPGGADLVGRRVRLTAPADGTVARRAAETGRMVAAGEELFVIMSTGQFQVRAEAIASRSMDLATLAGRPARIHAHGALVATGLVRSALPTIDRITRTATLLIDVAPGSGSLRDGLLVDASVVVSDDEPTVVAPRSAILVDGPERFVFVRLGDRFHRQAVATGAEDDLHAEIIDGLVPGDDIVVEGAFALGQLRPRVVPTSDGHHHH